MTYRRKKKTWWFRINVSSRSTQRRLAKCYRATATNARRMCFCTFVTVCTLCVNVPWDSCCRAHHSAAVIYRAMTTQRQQLHRIGADTMCGREPDSCLRLSWCSKLTVKTFFGKSCSNCLHMHDFKQHALGTSKAGTAGESYGICPLRH